VLCVQMITVDAGTWALVVATGALAIFTALMAFATQKSVKSANRTASAAEADMRQSAELVRIGQEQVDAAQRQVQTATRALEVERQPLLVPTTSLEEWDANRMQSFSAFGTRSPEVQDFPVAKAWVETVGEPWVVVKMRSIGRGPAFIGEEVTDIAIEANGYRASGQATSTVVAVGDRATLVFNGRGDGPAAVVNLVTWIGTASTFTVTVRYSDIARQRWYTTSFMLGSERPNPSVNSIRFAEG
jgi:hypothetical protein